VTIDSFARLKALQPSPRRLTPASVDLANTPCGSWSDLPAGAQQLSAILGAQPQRNSFGEHLCLRRRFSEPLPLGAEPVHAAPARLDAAVLRLLAPDAPSGASNHEKWLFLDTETTGLAGGTGTYPFLVGIAWWDAGGLEVEQFFMREQNEEHSLLARLAERIAERPVIVSFNGKSFDWPLLETRYRMTRVLEPPVPQAHIDFLHPARNLWRLRLGSVRLVELEKHVLGWNRGADVISELIPQVYFDYLRGGSPEPLVSVFLHNQMDLRGLAALAARVLSLLESPDGHIHDPLEIFGLSRICERRGEAERARRLYELSIARPLPPATGRIARLSLARLAKRSGDHDVACELWAQMLDHSREGLEAYEQLAIHYEHRLREPRRALALAREALAELDRARYLAAIAPSTHKAWCLRFKQRLARLEAKARFQAGELESNWAARESNPKGN
jgi:uncharacterized protein